MPHTIPAALANAPTHPGRLIGGKPLDPANPLGDLAARVRHAEEQPTEFSRDCGIIYASKAAQRGACEAVNSDAYGVAADLVAVAAWLRAEIDAMDD